MAPKRKASESLKNLRTRPSPYHSTVTLFEAPLDSKPIISEGTPRRSGRAKSVIKLEADIEEVVLEKKTTMKKSRSKTLTKLEPTDQKSSSPKKSTSIKIALDVPHPTPEHWEEVYSAIQEIRRRIPAPVDTMGCEQAQTRETDPKARRVSTLIALMLSSQTKDEVTDAAVIKLRQALGGTITVEALINAEESTISESIQKVGFWRRKTGYIKQAAIRLRDDFDSDVPRTAEELCSLPGVGPKMAFLCLQAAWNLNLGIGVDVHVHRITNRLGWHIPPTKTPEETRVNLESWLPKDRHREINHMLVGFGQTVCLAVGPRCSECTLSSGLCPSAKIKKTRTKRMAVTKSKSLTPDDTDVQP